MKTFRTSPVPARAARLLACGLLLGLGAGSGAQAAGLSAGTRIDNVAQFTGADASGGAVSLSSNLVQAVVVHAPAVVVSPSGRPGQSVVATPGAPVALPYQITNPSNGPDRYDLVPVALTPSTSGMTLWEDDGDGVYNPALDTALGPVATLTLGEDATARVYVVYTLPDTTDRQIDLQVQSQASAGVRSEGNVSLVQAQQSWRLSFAPPRDLSVASGQVATTSYALRNEGSLPLRAADLALEAAELPAQGGELPAEFPRRWRLVGGVDSVGAPVSGPWALSPALALVGWTGRLDPGQTLSLELELTVPPLALGTQTDRWDVAARVVSPSGPLQLNQTPGWIRLPSSAAVLAGAVSVLKSASLCERPALAGEVSGTGQRPDADCAAPRLLAQGEGVAPGDVLLYRVQATNTGQGAVGRPVIADPLPAGVRALRLAAGLSGLTPQAGESPQALYSLDGLNWSAQAPTAAELAGLGAGTRLYVAIDRNADGLIDARDALIPGERAELLMTVEVR